MMARRQEARRSRDIHRPQIMSGRKVRLLTATRRDAHGRRKRAPGGRPDQSPERVTRKRVGVRPFPQGGAVLERSREHTGNP